MAPPAVQEPSHGALNEPPHPNESDDINGEKEVTVLVTGFGPFQQLYPINPSYEITKSLPQIFPQPTPGGHRVRVIAYSEPIRVVYSDVRELVPKLHSSLEGKVDLVLHIGMASGRRFYAIERNAHRDGYFNNKDIDGQTVRVDDGLVRFGDCPPVLQPSVNFDLVFNRWTANVRGRPMTSPAFAADCRPSNNAGYYLCDYLYFNSLAWYARASGTVVGGKASDRPVLFFHVPPESEPEVLEKGVEVTMALIEAMVDTWVEGSATNGVH